MQSIGIIAEYNPFHNGHKFQIEAAKKMTGAQCSVILMSGDYVQRGAPAFADKYLRTEMALNGGADIVFELPVLYAVSSAEYFAFGAVSLFNALGCVDHLCFGSECGSLFVLDQIASVLLHEPEAFRIRLKGMLKEGVSFPAARAAALQSCFQNTEESADIGHIVSQPNNILGIEYIKALKKTGSGMLPVTIRRSGASYHAVEIPPGGGCSAKALRTVIEGAGRDAREAEKILHAQLDADMIPANQKLLYQNIGKRLPVLADDFSVLLRHALRNLRPEYALEAMDFSPQFLHQITKQADLPFLFSDVAKQLKSKQYTYTRISRMLLRLLLDGGYGGIRPASPSPPGYLRLLGFRRSASSVLRRMQDHASIKIITKPADAKKDLHAEAYAAFQKDINASLLYQDIIREKYGTEPIHELKRQVLIL